MGVVYKLKQEVIDFIILKKKEAPSVSCRKLVDIIKTNFNLDVSKSSVNLVIKEYALSSPVGRRPVHKAPKNFLIPQDKKEQLFQNVAPFLSNVVEPEARPEAVAPVPENAASVLPSREIFSGADDAGKPNCLASQEAPHVEREDAGGQESLSSRGSEALEAMAVSSEEPVAAPPLLVSGEGEPAALPDVQDDAAPFVDAGEEIVFSRLLPDPLSHVSVPEGQRVEIELSKVRSPLEEKAPDVFWGEDKGSLYENAGLLLVGALLWDYQRTPILGEILAGDMKEAIAPVQWAGLELLALYQALVDEELSGPPQEGGRFLFDWFGLEQQRVDDLMSQIRLVREDPKFGWAVASWMETAAVLVASVRIAMKNGDVFYFDPFFSSCKTEFVVHPLRQVPLLSAVERVADRFLSNVRPFVLGEIPCSVSDDRLGRLLSLFDGEAPIEEVSLLDVHGERQAVFRDTPCMSRKFIFGTRLSSSEMARVDADEIANSSEYFDPFSDQEMSFFEGRIPVGLGSRGVRAVMVGPKETKKEFALLSNTKRRSEDLFWEYCSSGNSLFMGKDTTRDENYGISMGFSNNNGDENNNINPQDKGFERLIKRLRKEAFGLFFYQDKGRDERLIKDLLMLSGYYKTNNKGVFIRFVLPGEREISADFEKGVFLLNSRAICSYDGRRVHFSCERRKI